MCGYKKNGVAHLAQAGVFKCLFSRSNAAARISELVNIIVENKFDMECADVHGNTPLLLALFCSPVLELSRVVKRLIDAGADVHARNNYNEGSLHILLRRLSNCNDYTVDDTLVESLISTLELLVRKGCDPNLENIVGCTPVDAAMSPAAWPFYAPR